MRVLSRYHSREIYSHHQMYIAFHLQGVEEYKQDLRFVRIWVMYADYMEDPIDLFHFLKV